MRITVLGSGGWGTALALLLCSNGHSVTVWCHRQETADALSRTRENPLLPGVALPAEMSFTSSIAEAARAELIVMATPSFAVRQTAQLLSDAMDGRTLIVSVSKGIERGSSLRMSQIIEQVTGCSVAVLSGPSHAEEVGRGVPTGCVAAATERCNAELVQDVFMNERFRVYASPDVVGVELGAALKNVIALCAGVCDGMGCGDNTKALLMTRGLTEMARLGVALGGRKETFAGLAGVGDLIVTCTSQHSRNRRAGILIGQGVPTEQAVGQVGGVVEGYYAARSVGELAFSARVEMPIVRGAYNVLYEGRDPKTVMSELMTRSKKHEIEESWV